MAKEPSGTTILAKVHIELGKLDPMRFPKPDTSKTGNTLHPNLATAYFWRTVRKYAEDHEKAAFQALVEYLPDVEEAGAGDHELCESQFFKMTASISQPVRKFDEDALALALNKSKYKIPLAVTKEFIEACKLPTKGRVSISIIEKL
jgi:hypothetical protein